MAAFLRVTPTEKGLTAQDIISLAAQLKRRKVPPTTPVYVDHGMLQVPVKIKVTPLPAATPPTKKTPMRGAKKGKH